MRTRKTQSERFYLEQPNPRIPGRIGLPTARSGAAPEIFYEESHVINFRFQSLSLVYRFHEGGDTPTRWSGGASLFLSRGGGVWHEAEQRGGRGLDERCIYTN